MIRGLLAPASRGFTFRCGEKGLPLPQAAGFISRLLRDQFMVAASDFKL